ncbi:MAG: DUF3006 family protein [Myxococcales bacterium]|nr:DUF3006 family protein [Myxococcales bacterium]
MTRPNSSISIVVDRIEMDIAVVEYKGRQYDLPCAWFTPEPQEGSVWTLELQPNPESTDALAFRVRQTTERLDSKPLGDGDELEL